MNLDPCNYGVPACGQQATAERYCGFPEVQVSEGVLAAVWTGSDYEETVSHGLRVVCFRRAGIDPCQTSHHDICLTSSKIRDGTVAIGNSEERVFGTSNQRARCPPELEFPVLRTCIEFHARVQITGASTDLGDSLIFFVKTFTQNVDKCQEIE